MHVNYVTVASEKTASYRMRISGPGHVINAYDDEIHTTESRSCNEEADLNVFSKHWNMEENLAAIQNTTTETVFDVTDDHFDRKHGDYYRSMITFADKVTCNTDAMQTRIYSETGRLASVIPDPVTFPKGEFKYNPDPKFLWFGSVVNVHSVAPLFSILPNLTIITDANVMLPTGSEDYRAIRWAPGVVEEHIKAHDIVVIPRNNEPWALTKSPNRAVDALYAGKYVMTDFPEVYGGLEPYIYVGNLEDGIESYHNDDQKEFVEMGQEYIEKNYNLTKVAEMWSTTFKTFNKDNQ